MKSFIIKNWVGMFLLLLVLSLSFLGWIAIEINDGLAKFLEKSEGDDKRMDVIGSIFGTSVAIASALVAIILARTALLFAENEEKREFKNKIEERVKDINKTSHKITLEARKIGVNLKNHFEQLNDSSFKNDFVKPNLLKDELKKIKDELNKIQDEALFFMVYKNNSDNFLNEIKNCIKLFEKPKSYSIFSCNNNEVNCIKGTSNNQLSRTLF